MLKYFFLLLNFLLWISSITSLNTDPLLIKQIQDEKIAFEKQWLNLLHYEKKMFGGYKSRADKQSFFLNPNGIKDPENELLSNLDAFTSSLPQKSDDHAICKFPARYKWLKSRLKLNDTIFPKPECSDYKDYFTKIKARSVSLVFVSANINEPASMFGHTFIRLRRNIETHEEERDHTFSFVAKVNTSNLFSYLYKGVVAGFEGNLDFVLMRQRIATYNITENRNMWELNLNLTQEEIDRIVDHTWEFRNTAFDYFFFDENCAYYNLAILEVGKPELDVYRHFLYTVAPSDTVRGILKTQGILNSAGFFPANLMDYKTNYVKLTSEEKQAFKELVKDNKATLPLNPKINNELLLTTAISYILLKTDKATEKLSESDELILKNLESLQANLGLKRITHAKPDYTNPSIGHFTSMISGTFGTSKNGEYTSLFIRPAFHDLLDSPLGYYPFSEIQAFAFELRYSIAKQQLELERTELVKVISIKPIEPNYFSGSWLIHLGSRAVRELETQTTSAPHSFFGKFGYGSALQFDFMPGNFLIYAMLHGALEGSTGYEKGYRISPGILGGIIWNMSDIFTITFGSVYEYILSNSPQPNYYSEAGVNLLLADFIALESRFQYYYLYSFYDAKFSVKFYF